MSPCILIWTPWPQLGGLFHNLDSIPVRSSLFIAGISGEAQTCVCSPFSSWDSSDLKGQLQLESLGFSDRNCQGTQLRCRAKNRNQLPIAYGKIQRPRLSCAEAQTRIYYQQASPSGKTWAVLRALLRSICCSYECTKRRNQASVRGCTQSYYQPYRL